MFDNGPLIKGQELLDSLLSIMQEDNKMKPRGEKNPLVEVHDSVWERVVEVRASITQEVFHDR